MIRQFLCMMAVVSLPLAAWAGPDAPSQQEKGAAGAQAAPAAPSPQPPPGPRDLPFTPENVLAVVTLHAEELQTCYEEAMARRGSTAKDAPAGRVIIGWTITVDGLVSDVKVKKSEIAERLVTDCMMTAIRRWEFPKPGKPQPVEFPFDLKAISGTKTMIGERNKVNQ